MNWLFVEYNNYMNNKKSQKTEYQPQEMEQKWQLKWETDKTFTPSLQTANKARLDSASRGGPYFNLMMFPYPSAEGLHVGNMYAFTGADVHGRFKRMQGEEVFEPIGLDGFGIHSENYAMKVGRHPAEQAQISAKNFYRQLKATGNAYDWTRTLETYDPEYYKWTQWLFIQMFKAGLAYRKKAMVNWCPSDKTVLADEQVIDGKCERDGAIVEKRALEQWFFKITDYSDRLLAGLDTIDWPEKIKIAQRNWIGKSTGARIKFKIVDSDERTPTNEIEVFTTRPDTLHGVTFMVISPEHPLVAALLSSELKVESLKLKEIREYVDEAKKKNEQERADTDKVKTGVDSGLFAINPVNSEKIPVWIADYVLMSYGTGAIMAVPAHDTRDFEFAKKYKLPIKQVIVADNKFGQPLEELTEAYTGEGGIVNSGDDWNEYHVPAALPKIMVDVETKGIGVSHSTYHLRDWLISRQRYWGPPIPMIFCENCSQAGRGEREDMPGWWTVPAEQLPVALPNVEDWRPEGEGTSPLANHPEFYDVKCPDCGENARRETDVSDTFLDSAWYYLRYLTIGAESANKQPYDIDIVKKWCPAAIYIGGAEHSVLHLLYVRFVAMVLHDMKSELSLPFEEPFPKFFAHGLIVKDGAKMSKSKGNVVVPDKYIEKFGADTLRMYLMFLGQFREGGDFRDSGIEGMFRFVRRAWNLFNEKEFTKDSDETLRMINKTVKEVGEDISNFSYNTAIAKLMEFYNFISVDTNSWSKDTATSYLKMFAPFAPHMTEELWQELGVGSSQLEKETNSQEPIAKSQSIHFSAWPEFDEKYLVLDEVTIPIQVNGKRRGEISIEFSVSSIEFKNEIEDKAKEAVRVYLEGKEIKKVIYVPGKIINFVV